MSGQHSESDRPSGKGEGDAPVAASGAYTLWNSPRGTWVEPLAGVRVTEAAIAMGKREVAARQSELEARLRPYRTPVTEETLTRPLK